MRSRTQRSTEDALLGPNLMFRGMNTRMRMSSSPSLPLQPGAARPLNRLCQRPIRLHQLGKLQSEEPAVGPALRKQFFMRSALDDAPRLDDVNEVGMKYCRKPMCNHDGRLPFRQHLELALDDFLGLAVEGRGRFVQKNDRCILEEGSGKRNALTLPA